MRNSFIFGVVWLAIIIGIVSFGFTVFFLEDNPKQEETSSISQNIEEEKEIVYETNQTAIRTNPAANKTEEKYTEKEVVDLSENTNKTKNIGKTENINKAEITVDISNKIDEAEITSGIIAEKENTEVIEVVNSNTKSFIRPVNNEILRPFSPEQLIYSQTLKEWNTHVGTDFKAKLGDEVKAIQVGKVKKVASNDKYGEYIIIEHADGYESLYANVTVLDAIKEGNQIEQGQLIGYVAESFGFEVAEETHLHFELKKDGKYVTI